MLRRTKPYLSEGRYQTEDEAKEIDIGIKNVLEGFKLPIFEVDAEESELLKIYQKIVKGHS